MSQQDTENTKGGEALKRILEQDQSTPTSGDVTTLEDAMNDLWRHLCTNKDYVMTRDEFKIFEFFRSQFSSSENKQIAERASKLYWIAQDRFGPTEEMSGSLSDSPSDIKSPTQSPEISIPPSPEIGTSTLQDTYDDIIRVADSLLTDDSLLASYKPWALSINQYLLGMKLWGEAIKVDKGTLKDITQDPEVTMLMSHIFKSSLDAIKELQVLSRSLGKDRLDIEQIDNILENITTYLADVQATVPLFEAFEEARNRSSVLHQYKPVALAQSQPTQSDSDKVEASRTDLKAQDVQTLSSTNLELIAKGDDAQDMASEVLMFTGYLPTEVAADPSMLATELFGLKSALLNLDVECKDPRNRRIVEALDEERYVLLKSLDFTFNDMRRHFSYLRGSSYHSMREAYCSVWDELDTYIYNESRNHLSVRMNYYKTFVIQLTDIVIGGLPGAEFEDLFDRIDHLLDVQEEENQLVEDVEHLTLGMPRRVSAWERRRPYGLDRSGQPIVPGSSRDQIRVSPESRTPIPLNIPQEAPFSPPEPSESTSPSTAIFSSVAESSPTASDASLFSEDAFSGKVASSSASSLKPAHWLPEVWSQQHANTRFNITGSLSACFGPNMRGAKRKLQEDHTSLVTLAFDQLELRIFFRIEDYSARVWCRIERRNGFIEATEPVHKLEILRKDSTLLLCKYDGNKRLGVWAILRFPSYERLVLFHCTFLALKAQEESPHAVKLEDNTLGGEKILFGSKIHDDNYVHILQILKDTDSGGVRLQASVLRGPIKRSPVWTAFIKHTLVSSDWISRPEPKELLLADLPRFVFTRDYEPQMAPTGEAELVFLREDDATNFMRVIEVLRKGVD